MASSSTRLRLELPSLADFWHKGHETELDEVASDTEDDLEELSDEEDDYVFREVSLSNIIA